MREDVVGLVLPAGEAGLLPEVCELLEQRSAGPQVQHILSGQRVIQERVVQMGEQPENSQKQGEDRKNGFYPAEGGNEKPQRFKTFSLK